MKTDIIIIELHPLCKTPTHRVANVIIIGAKNLRELFVNVRHQKLIMRLRNLTKFKHLAPNLSKLNKVANIFVVVFC